LADSKNINKLDEKLVETGTIDADILTDYKKVHTFLNTHVRKNGKILSESTFSIGEEELRQWLMVLYKKGASQDKLTSYLRVGLAHLCYDFVESTYKQISVDDLVARALVSFKNRKFHKTFFKVAVIEAKTSIRGKKELKAKKKPLKKAIKKKSSSKTKAKSLKSPIKKKSLAKKKSLKKKPEKKGFFSRLFS
jgi:hypothetical protein